MSKVLNNLLGVLSLPSTRFTSAKQGRHFLQNPPQQQESLFAAPHHASMALAVHRAKPKQGCCREPHRVCLKSLLHPKDALSFRVLVQGVPSV